ncbi:MAG: DEAD/DEAH box helicase family protein [Deltaproteobacteria bacterium]
MLQPKEYQQRALHWLQRYFENCHRLNSASTAFYETTCEIYEGYGLSYRPVRELPGLPYVCLRIPTGGGKTLVASYAVAIANKYLLHAEQSLVVWLTPSDAIREQTLTALRERQHPYRQALDTSLGNVTVLDIAEALSLQRSVLDTDTVIIVATMQAFRREGTEDLQVYRMSGSLMSHFTGLTDEALKEVERLEDGTPVHSLVNVFRIRKPLVIVDEAHNARTSLSFATLARFRPSCILELTATPNTKGDEENPPSNVLYSVSAAELKSEEMIKLPIRLKTRPNWKELLGEAIRARNGLEKSAQTNQVETGEYLRPIMLLQAQPRSKERETITVDEVERCLLEEFRIPREQVVRATGEDRGLDGVDVLYKDCPIRYIITVQALKEGWDCPFAYVLCTVAEQSSKTAVEQILGRIMRLPKARKKTRQELNIAYAFAASRSFDEAARTLQDGLVQNRFERQEAKDLVAPLSEPLMELFGFDRPAVPSPVAKVFETPYKAIPPFLSNKVVYDADVGEIAIREYLSPEEEEQLKGCFSTEESKEEIRKLCITVREKDEYKRLSPAERNVPFSIPVLSIRQGSLLEQFEKTHIDNVGWTLSSDDATLSEGEFSLATDVPQIGEVDIRKNGKLEARFLPELEKQMTLFMRHSGWNVAQLVHWLDRSFAHPDLAAEETGIFLTRLVTYLIEIRDFFLDQLVDHRYKMSQSIQRKLNELRLREQRKVFESFLLPVCATPLSVNAEVQFRFQPDVYPCNTRYDGGHRFRKHYYPVVGELRAEGEEFECATFIDNLPEVRYWVRNLPGPGRENSSFWIQTSTDKFYPDFVSELVDGRQLVVEYKNARDWSNEDSTEKRNLGELWEERSRGRCLFVMPKGIDDLESIRTKIR